MRPLKSGLPPLKSSFCSSQKGAPRPQFVTLLFFFTRQFYGRRALLWWIILTPARIITTLRPSFTTKSNPVSDALRISKDSIWFPFCYATEYALCSWFEFCQNFPDIISALSYLFYNLPLNAKSHLRVFQAITLTLLRAL